MEGGALQDGAVKDALGDWIAVWVDLDEGAPSEVLECKQTQYIPEMVAVGAGGDVRAHANYMEAGEVVEFLEANR